MSKRLSKIVEEVLQESVKARNSDRHLILGVLNKLGMRFNHEQIEFLMSVSFESITRCRRKFQEQGKYVASEPIRRERRFKSYQVQQAIPTTKPESVPELIDGPRTQEQTSLI